MEQVTGSLLRLRMIIRLDETKIMAYTSDLVSTIIGSPLCVLVWGWEPEECSMSSVWLLGSWISSNLERKSRMPCIEIYFVFCIDVGLFILYFHPSYIEIYFVFYIDVGLGKTLQGSSPNNPLYTRKHILVVFYSIL
jgi:hypothetical protein